MIIRMTELLESDENKQSNAMTVPIGIGKNGAVVLLDVQKAPHIMIGGTTGSGKSVMLHNIIHGLIVKNTPERLQFVLIDTKRIEFDEYEGSPYPACPVIKDCSSAIAALKCISDEIKRRYELFAQNRVLIYDQMIRISHEPMPRIVVVIDECADLLMRERRITVESMRHIVQRGRAAGVHLIVASRNRLSNVFHGKVKAFIPTRMTFRLNGTKASKESGAEKSAESRECRLKRNGKKFSEHIRAAYLSAEDIKAIAGTKAAISDELRRFDADLAHKIDAEAQK